MLKDYYTLEEIYNMHDAMEKIKSMYDEVKDRTTKTSIKKTIKEYEKFFDTLNEICKEHNIILKDEIIQYKRTGNNGDKKIYTK